MKSSAKQTILGVGEVLLFSYLALVIIIAILRLITGFPTVEQLASSPALLVRGEWWRLVTSALVINGPALPQIMAIATLGTLGIYFGGSWTFWSTAVAGHLLGTLLAYAGFVAVWLQNHALAAHLMTDPDYGVSLIWSAALGIFAAVAWLGEQKVSRWPVRPLLVAGAAGVMLIVTIYSDEMAAVQHLIAFAVGFSIVVPAGRSRRIYRARRPLIKGRCWLWLKRLNESF
jgi:hypothetical protein